MCTASHRVLAVSLVYRPPHRVAGVRVRPFINRHQCFNASIHPRAAVRTRWPALRRASRRLGTQPARDELHSRRRPDAGRRRSRTTSSNAQPERVSAQGREGEGEHTEGRGPDTTEHDVAHKSGLGTEAILFLGQGCNPDERPHMPRKGSIRFSPRPRPRRMRVNPGRSRTQSFVTVRWTWGRVGTVVAAVPTPPRRATSSTLCLLPPTPA